MSSPRRRSATSPAVGPWWVLASLVLAGTIAACWWQAGGRSDPEEQLTSVAAAAGALVAALVANGAVLLRARRAVHIARSRLLSGPRVAGAAAPTSQGGLEGRFGAPGLRFHHARTCAMLDGRDALLLDDDERALRDSCPLCRTGVSQGPGVSDE